MSEGTDFAASVRDGVGSQSVNACHNISEMEVVPNIGVLVGPMKNGVGVLPYGPGMLSTARSQIVSGMGEMAEKKGFNCAMGGLVDGSSDVVSCKERSESGSGVPISGDAPFPLICALVMLRLTTMQSWCHSLWLIMKFLQIASSLTCRDAGPSQRGKGWPAEGKTCA